ncbi:MAG: HEAT repeat domain-containing protein, partial [Planctomycetaceae bacterium]
DPGFRRRSAIALGLMGPGANEAVPDLKPLLDDEQPEIRMAAAEALWSITADATAVLPTAIRELQSEDRQMRMRAVRLFERMGPKARPAVEELQRLVRDDRPHVRQAAAKALESIESR